MCQRGMSRNVLWTFIMGMKLLEYKIKVKKKITHLIACFDFGSDQNSYKVTER